MSPPAAMNRTARWPADDPGDLPGPGQVVGDDDAVEAEVAAQHPLPMTYGEKAAGRSGSSRA